MVRYLSPSNRKSVTRIRSILSKAHRSPIPRVTPCSSMRAVHKCTRKTQNSPGESDIHIEYCQGDKFSGEDDQTILGHLDQGDGDSVTDSDWDEQATIIALLDDEEGELDTNDREAVVHRLQPAFTAHGRAAKEQSKNTLVSVITHVGDTHKRISQEVHPSLLHGVVLFEKNSRNLEDAARREQDQVVSTYARVTKALQELSFQLQGVCAESDTLFDEYEKAINEHVQRLRDYAKRLPGNIEKLISKLDKAHKSVTAEDHAKAKEAILRGILDRF